MYVHCPNPLYMSLLILHVHCTLYTVPTFCTFFSDILWVHCTQLVYKVFLTSCMYTVHKLCTSFINTLYVHCTNLLYMFLHVILPCSSMLTKRAHKRFRFGMDSTNTIIQWIFFYGFYKFNKTMIFYKDSTNATIHWIFLMDSTNTIKHWIFYMVSTNTIK